ncbi:uncharacterized protein LOC131638077 [Vicia villosa]|uniref:uncharacterized protein LOC131638077 n=1 Tax=Vicia villosa TaxID=3911 RepID=UPI00273CA55C|nr:uncharacterized protein LOC131638077 [Vicia villosa]
MIEERSDRSLATSSWLQLFSSAKLFNLIASHSDHNPILLNCDPCQGRRTRITFRFENWCVKGEGVKDVVQDSWVAEHHHIVVVKLAECAADLDRWNKLCIKKNREEKDRLHGILEWFRGGNDPVSVVKFMEAHNA